MLIRRSAILLALLCGGWIHGNAGSTGSAQLNLGGGDFVPANVINVLKTSVLSFSTPSDFLKIDDDGYLTSSPSGNVSIAFPSAGTMWSGTTYKLAWDAGVQFKMTFNFVAASCVAAGATFTGCAGASTVLTTTGGAGSLTFTTAATQFSMFYNSGGTFSHSSGALSLYRISDEAAFLAGEIFTPEFKSAIAGLSPKTIRPMGWVQAGAGNFNGETNWNYRAKPSTFTWAGHRYPPGASASSAISGTDTYTGVSAPDTPGSWINGETYIAVWTNANTSTTPTLDIGSRGAKTIIKNDGLTAPAAGTIAAGSVGTVVYDGILDKLLYSPDGIVASVPVEAQAQLANKINANLWATIPAWAGDNYVTNWANAVCGSLNGSLYLYPEYSNEVWNFSFPQTQWALQRGLAFGWVSGSGQALYGWYGLRVRQIMGNLIPASGCAGHLLRRVMAYQAGGDSTNINNRFKGVQLTPGNAAYNAFTGSANYSVKPNRPIDATEVLAYAPYGGGTNLCTGPDLNCSPTAANAPFYQTLVTAWEGGDHVTPVASIDNDIRQGTTLSQTVTASGTTFTTPLAHGFTANSTDIIFQVTGGTLYSGITANTLYRVTATPLTTTFTIQPYVGGFPSGASVNAGSAGSGTVIVGASGPENLMRLASTWYQFGESNAALFDGDRPAAMPNLRVEQYEGNMEPKGLSAAQCTALSISGTNCTGSIAAAILAWKNDPKAALTQAAYYNQFIGVDAATPPTFGLMPHSKTPAQLILPNGCGGVGVAADYALLSDCLPNSTPFQTYNGFAAFHSGLN